MQSAIPNPASICSLPLATQSVREGLKEDTILSPCTVLIFSNSYPAGLHN